MKLQFREKLYVVAQSCNSHRPCALRFEFFCCGPACPYFHGRSKELQDHLTKAALIQVNEQTKAGMVPNTDYIEEDQTCFSMQPLDREVGRSGAKLHDYQWRQKQDIRDGKRKRAIPQTSWIRRIAKKTDRDDPMPGRLRISGLPYVENIARSPTEWHDMNNIIFEQGKDEQHSLRCRICRETTINPFHPEDVQKIQELSDQIQAQYKKCWDRHLKTNWPSCHLYLSLSTDGELRLSHWSVMKIQTGQGVPVKGDMFKIHSSLKIEIKQLLTGASSIDASAFGYRV